MRGKPRSSVTASGSRRIIPAHAGQTSVCVAGSHRCPDHPRACGANEDWRLACFNRIGSSPRMRGKPRPMRVAAWRARIIPAHAGQTSGPWCRRRARPDHPRACGANLPSPYAVPEPSGSSPRMRGKPIRDPIDMTAVRIIPAHAGQTRPTGWRGRSGPDHPRACGANGFDSSKLGGDLGSSPRMRGKLRQGLGHKFAYRIIPAHAGQTRRCRSTLTARTDHPRACGANWVLRQHVDTVAGSSPRMRGKPASGELVLDGFRIIPAHAGQTRITPAPPHQKADHPRACGANHATC